MANTMTSVNMSLTIPVVGVDPGPQWATDVNNCLTVIDAHNHSPGFGVQIGADGLNITSDLTFNSTNLLAIRAARFTPQNAVLTLPADLAELYVVSNDLFFNDGTGAPIRITQNGSIVGTSGSISGLVPPASVSYASGTFTFQSNVNTPANLDAASIILRNFTASSKGLTLSPPNAMASNYTITLPSLPSNPALLKIDAAGNVTASSSTLVSSQPSPYGLYNVGVLASVAANALTVTLKQSDGTTGPNADSPALMSFRSATATSGSYTSVFAITAPAVIVPNGATLGLVSGRNQYVYVYAINNSGAIELAVAGSQSFDEGSLQSTVAITAGATNPSVLYSTTLRSNVAVRLIGRIGVNESVSGVYATAPFEVAVVPLNNTTPRSSVYVYDPGGTSITRSYAVVGENVGSGITYTADLVNGDTFTVNQPGVYSITATDSSTTTMNLGITVNSASPTTGIDSLTYAQGWRSMVKAPNYSGGTFDGPFLVSATLACIPGDVIRVQQSSIGAATSSNSRITVSCHVIKISD